MSRDHIHLPATTGERIADAVVSGMGSWRFIIIQSIIVALWMVLNSVAWFSHWDPMPFILLNLLFSTQAAYASPLILMASNRQAAKDAKRDDLEATEIAAMFSNHDELLSINRTLLDMQKQQMDILDRLPAPQQKGRR